MPRQPRLDAPDLLHHVIARGVDRKKIFRDNRDRERFCESLGELVVASGARVYAWCLLSNHFHLVVRTGDRPLSWIMQRLMTGHAVRFNLRHGRSGHLFQNRYKSIVVEEEPHFLELVRYVALNPVRARMVQDARELDDYPWSGHAVLVGTKQAPWQDVEEVLGRFGPNPVEAREGYRNFVIAGWNQGRRNELIGGGLIRSAGGVDEVLRRRPEEREAADERILGSGQFVEAVWRAVEPEKAVTPKREWQAISKEVSERFEIDEKRIFDGSRRRTISSARAEFFGRCREEAGLSVAQLARLSGLHPASVSKAIDRGRREGKAGQKRK